MGELIFGRDYMLLNTEEKPVLEEIKKDEADRRQGILLISKSKYREYPKAVRHYLSLFPNYFLDSIDLSDESQHFSKTLEQFRNLLGLSSTGEREIVSFIKSNKAYFMIGAILQKGFYFGPHACFVFPEFRLGSEFKADYLIAGENSHGYHFVFVELEDHKGSISLQDGEFGLVIRKGTTQVNRWRIWLDENFTSLRPTFEKVMSPNYSVLPREFTVLDRSRIHFAVIAGRRTNYSPHTQRLQREEQDNRVHILHYDNLVENAEIALQWKNY